MAKFKEFAQFSGVDESVTPTGIIVPERAGAPDKFNIVRLAGGQGIRPPRPPPSAPTIKIEDITDLPAVEFHMIPPGDRLFKISGGLPLTTQVQAGGDTLRIAVLKQRTVKLSIRPVQVWDPQNPRQLINHSKAPIGDINAMVDQMNAIWTPQANVVFTLVPSTTVQFDNPDYTQKDQKTGNMNVYYSDDFWKLLFANRNPNADLTMFFVGQFSQGPNAVNVEYPHGNTDWPAGAPWAVSLISDAGRKFPLVMAHEAGHFLGQMYGDQHTDDRDRNGKIIDSRKQLMANAGGSLGFKLIPYDLVISKFNPLSPKPSASGRPH